MARKYRAQRRNEARGQPWRGALAKVIEMPAVHPNKRDRSEAAEAKRAAHMVVDFTGYTGLIRSQINHSPSTLHQKKPKRGWAAKVRRAPFANAFDDARMAKIAARHVHPRSERVA